MGFLINERGEPQPPTTVLERLRGVHSGLGLRYTPHAGPVWAITLTWGPEDARWALVQAQALPEARAFDIVGYLPVDCPLDEAPAYIAQVFRTSTKAEVQRMADAVERHNQRVPVADAVESAVAAVLDQDNPATAPRRRGRPRKSV